MQDNCGCPLFGDNGGVRAMQIALGPPRIATKRKEALFKAYLRESCPTKTAPHENCEV